MVQRAGELHQTLSLIRQAFTEATRPFCAGGTRECSDAFPLFVGPRAAGAASFEGSAGEFFDGPPFPWAAHARRCRSKVRYPLAATSNNSEFGPLSQRALQLATEIFFIFAPAFIIGPSALLVRGTLSSHTPLPCVLALFFITVPGHAGGASERLGLEADALAVVPAFSSFRVAHVSLGTPRLAHTFALSIVPVLSIAAVVGVGRAPVFADAGARILDPLLTVGAFAYLAYTLAFAPPLSPVPFVSRSAFIFWLEAPDLEAFALAVLQALVTPEGAYAPHEALNVVDPLASLDVLCLAAVILFFSLNPAHSFRAFIVTLRAFRVGLITEWAHQVIISVFVWPRVYAFLQDGVPVLIKGALHIDIPCTAWWRAAADFDVPAPLLGALNIVVLRQVLIRVVHEAVWAETVDVVRRCYYFCVDIVAWSR